MSIASRPQIPPDTSPCDSASEQESLFDTIGRLAQVAGWVMDLPGGEFRCTREYATLVGHPPRTTLQADERFRYFDPVCQRIGRVAMARALRDGTPYDLEARIVRPDGEVRWVRTVCQPILDQGRVVQLRGTVQDVTERHQMEEKLRLSERRHRAITDAALPDAMFVHDHLGRLVEANRNACLSLGYERAELLQMTVFDIETDHCLREIQSEWASMSPGVSRVLRGHHRRKDGSVFPVDVFLGLVNYGDERLYIALCRDTTYRDAAERASQANRAKTEFLANMSHELRTPLNAVLGFAEVLRSGMAGDLTEQQARFVGEICGASQHLLALINDALDLAKVEAGKSELKLEPCVVAEVLASASLAARERALRAELEFRIEIAADAGTALLDGRKVKQVVLNLLSNALKFNRPGGTVTLGARTCCAADVGLCPSRPGRLLPNGTVHDERFLEISVEDEGPGIDEDGLGRLFEPFVQLGTPRTQGEDGTGLGLSLVRRLVELHGGTLGVQSEPGRGSRFVVWLPLRRP